MSEQIRLPDTLATWPYPRELNPHFEEVKAESGAWIESFNAFDAKAQRAFDLCDFNLCAALGYPFLDKARLRTAADLMNFFFVFDEYSDIADEKEVRKQADMIMDALRNPHKPRPEGECVLGEIARQFWELAIKTSSPPSQRRFIDTFDVYTDAVVQQAEDRTKNHLRSIESYLNIRRAGTVGVKPSFVMIELEMDLPDEVMNHPKIVDLSNWCIDMSILSNDMVSYDVEQARGDEGHNIITIVMHELNVDVNGAMAWLADFHDVLATNFLENKDQLPSWGEPLDSDVAKYVDGLGRWVRGLDAWNFESHRYFGDKGLEIQKRRWLTLTPKISSQI